MARNGNVLGDWNIQAKDVVDWSTKPHDFSGEIVWYSPGGIGIRPSDQAILANDLLTLLDLPYEAEFSANGTIDDLIHNLEMGYPSVVSTSAGETRLGFPKPPFGHAMLVVGYDFDVDEVIFLDPWQYKSEVLLREPVKKFLQEWRGQPNVFIPIGSMVTYMPVVPTQVPIEHKYIPY